MVWLSVVAIVVMATLYMAGRRLSRRVPPRDDLDWLPVVLHDAELVWSEKSFRSDGVMPIAVRIDRAYRSPREGLVLIEFKRREKRRAYLSDVVELSTQRYVLQLAGHVVSRRGFVVVILPGGTRSQALAVDLQNDRQVLQRVARLVELMERRASPRGAAQPAFCESCGHRDECSWTGSSPRVPL
jgi:CRISPR/Cas system-associated exonuclease Cas4 (RecB family)